MHAVIAEATTLLSASLPATVDLAVSAAPTAMVVSGVHTQLLPVVLNLCNNAAQAMDQAGRIELQIAAEEVAEPRSLNNGSLPPGPFARIVVSDSGSGIDEAALDRIFEPFFTTRANVYRPWPGNHAGNRARPWRRHACGKCADRWQPV